MGAYVGSIYRGVLAELGVLRSQGLDGLLEDGLDLIEVVVLELDMEAAQGAVGRNLVLVGSDLLETQQPRQVAVAIELCQQLRELAVAQVQTDGDQIPHR